MEIKNNSEYLSDLFGSGADGFIYMSNQYEKGLTI